MYVVKPDACTTGFFKRKFQLDIWPLAAKATERFHAIPPIIIAATSPSFSPFPFYHTKSCNPSQKTSIDNLQYTSGAEFRTCFTFFLRLRLKAKKK